MSEHYECIRAAKRRRTFVIHYHFEGADEGFYRMPETIRRLGPWTDTQRGEVARLRPEYRLQLARQNYVLIEDAPGGWKAEA
jgi:hypothetical protein